MKIKRGDTVKILSGKDKGKTGKVISVSPVQRKAVVEGVNIMTKHLKPKGKDKVSGRIKVPGPMLMSKLMLIDPVSNKPVRVGFKVEKGKKVRISKKTGKEVTGKIAKETEKVEAKEPKTVKKAK